MHRVTYAPGPQGDVTRYSLAYLVRPFADARMKRLVGGLIPKLEVGEEDSEMTSREWEIHRGNQIKAGLDNARSKGGKPLALGKKGIVM